MELKTLFNNIVDAIHEKDGTSDGIVAADFPQRIRDIHSVGSNQMFDGLVEGVDWIADGRAVIQMPGSIIDISYGNGRYVMISDASTLNSIVYSDDAVHWYTVELPEAIRIGCIAFGNGVFVAPTYLSNRVFYSNNGKDWEISTLPASARWIDIIFIGDRFVTIANTSNKSAWSFDGITWIESVLPVSSTWKSLAYGNERVVALISSTSSRDYAYSDDGGFTWIKSTIPKSSSWTRLVYGNDKFVAIDSNNNIIISEDGLEWDLYQTNFYNCILAFGNGKFIAAHSPNTIYYSNDIVNWYASNVPKLSGNSVNSVDYLNGKFLCVVDSSRVIFSLNT